MSLQKKNLFQYQNDMSFNPSHFSDRLLRALSNTTRNLKISLQSNNRTEAIQNLRFLGIKQFLYCLKEGQLDYIRDDEKTNNLLYKRWFEKSEPTKYELDQQKISFKTLKYFPLFSIIILVSNNSEFNVNEIEKNLESILRQTYSNWEVKLLISDQFFDISLKLSKKDSRIKITDIKSQSLDCNHYNEAIDSAQGEYIIFVSSKDEFSPNALFENALFLNETSQTDIIYTDEDQLNSEGIRIKPHFKPDWSPDLFYSSNYTSQLGIFRRKLIQEVGGFQKGYEDVYTYDLFLRLIEKTNKIYHLPKVLFHKRNSETNLLSRQKEFQIKALEEHFKRLRIDAEITKGLSTGLLRVKRIFSTNPKVSIIIPTHNSADILEICLNSIQTKTAYKHYEIIIVDNNSDDLKTLNYLESFSEHSRIRVIKYPHHFNFSALNNFAVTHTTGELLLFLNNDTEVISNEWLEAMIEHAIRPEVGAVGARLLYPNNTIQHAGVVLGIKGIADHSHKYFSKKHAGYFGRAKAIQNVSAVTGACMMVRKNIFTEIGGFNEKDLAIAYNDIDFCLKLRQKGLLNIYTPYSELFHHESLSRGYEKTRGKILRFQQEREYMLRTWKEILQNDPYYNPNLTLEREDFSISLVT